MAHILFLTPQLPYPPQQGTTLRNFNLIAGLTARGHVVDVATFGEESAGRSTRLTDICRRVVALPAPVRMMAQRGRDTLFHRLPDMALRLESRAMHDCVNGLLAAERYDVVEVEGIEMAPYGQRSSGGILVFDDHNAEYVLQKRACLTDARRPQRWVAAAYSLVQWRKLEGYERSTCRAADAVVAVSDADRQALQRLVPGLKVAVVPNGVDLALYRPGAVSPLPGLAQPAQPALVFTGKMDYRPNVDAVLWFAEMVFPRIRARVPGAQFFIVGQQPHARLAALAGQPGISITGRVPDVRPYLAGAAVYVVPLRIGGGTRLKVLEAMAAGLPIVSTRLGCDGFPFADGCELRFGDDPESFAGAVLELLDDREQAARLGAAARAYVAAHYGWDTIVPELEAVYDTAAWRAG